MSADHDPLAPWDRKTRLVTASPEYGAGLSEVSGVLASRILKDRSVPLNNWEAGFLQGVVYRPRRLNALEVTRLKMLERRAAGRVGA